MTENRIKYALQRLNTDVQDLNRRATERVQKIPGLNKSQKSR